MSCEASDVLCRFSLKGKIAVITGGCGLLGLKHAETVCEAGGIPVLLDLSEDRVKSTTVELSRRFSVPVEGFSCDITDEPLLQHICATLVKKYSKVDILINNAANNPKVENNGTVNFSRLETFPLDEWHRDIAVGLTGAMLCTRIFAGVMESGGVILNIASDLALVAPDQRIYRKDGLAEEAQPVKPVTYSVVKSGLLGLTRYCATYYASRNIRCNALAPGGVYTEQDDAFVAKLTNLIPLSRMANTDEYKGAVLFLISAASSYMTGACLSVDGGRTCW